MKYVNGGPCSSPEDGCGPSPSPTPVPQLQEKLDQIRSMMTTSPSKIVKEIQKRKAEELNDMSPAVKTIYNELMTSASKAKSPSLTRKLKVLKEKPENEQNGGTSPCF
ncbi:uncharacterized protein LOC117341312 [Pecten maximus]|uniref:uncharacterized protein LOC117341312 n=1 Tax=Pecten maximus TaxID=6579 RepID=UPI001458CA3F|nr:uncharacterized protein LOC117341312 [Pecten maximus]